MSAYDDLMAYTRTTEALSAVAGRTGWDQETMMPQGAADQRAEEMAALEAVLHARRSSTEPVSYTHLRAPRDQRGSRMPSSA